jgi:hypothetical protein
MELLSVVLLLLTTLSLMIVPLIYSFEELRDTPVASIPEQCQEEIYTTACM